MTCSSKVLLISSILVCTSILQFLLASSLTLQLILLSIANLASSCGITSRQSLLVSTLLLTADLFIALAWWKQLFFPETSVYLTKMVRLLASMSLKVIFLTHISSILATRASMASTAIPISFNMKSMRLAVNTSSLDGLALPPSIRNSLILLKSAKRVRLFGQLPMIITTCM